MNALLRVLWACLWVAGSYFPVAAQAGQWTWMHGASTVNGLGVWGTQGVAAPGNMPPALYEGANWTDLQGNFWIFGGMNFNGDFYVAMWRYEVATNMWTWMNGPQTLNNIGVYGTQGVGAPGNYPSSRGYGPLTWVDNTGDLWLYGGFGIDVTGAVTGLNDLWKYTIATNEWTWMKGSSTGAQPGITGTQGVPNPANVPSLFGESNCTWVDANNDLWFFGGQDPLSGVLNNIWRYNIATNTWTWMNGPNISGQLPVYGTQGQPSPSVNPGCRNVYASWVDCNDKFWLFGGAEFGSGNYGDMWRYDPATNLWTWMNGATVQNSPTTFTTRCSPSTTTFPTARLENRARWKDRNGRFWNFGGFVATPFSANLNDLWCYDPATNEFTWVSGSLAPNQSGVYGTQGVPAASNVPGARGGAMSFQDLQGNFWFFGGWNNVTITTFGDLWRYVPDTLCALSSIGANPLQAGFSAQPSTGCVPLAVTFTNTSLGAASYTWDFGGTGGSTATNPTHTFTTPGDYDVMLIAHAPGCNAATDTAIVTLHLTGPFPLNIGPNQTVCQGDSLRLDAGNPGSTYLWSNNATAQTISVGANGTYWVEVTDTAGCTVRDSVMVTFLHLPFSLGPDQVLCSGENTLLDAGYPGATYLWSTNATTQTIVVDTPGDYWAEVTLASGCVLRDTMSLFFSPSISPGLGSTATGCMGAQVQLSAINLPGASYLWSTGEVASAIGVTVAGSYWVALTDVAGCTTRDTITVSFLPSPIPNFPASSTICEGSDLLLDAGNPGSAYIWSTGAMGQTITVSQPGNYAVTITAPNGCASIHTVQLQVTPDFALDLGEDHVVCEEDSWELSSGFPTLLHQWSTGAQTTSIVTTASGTYSVKVWNACFEHSDSIRLTFRSDSAGPFIPSAFTPNGDGLNDELRIGGMHTDDTFHMQVFDRWGKLIFVSQDSRLGWDGTFQGDDAPEGIYVLWLQVTDCRGQSRPLRASITLLR